MFIPPNLSRVTCHVSRVTCHVSRVTCHLSCVTCHIFFVFFHFFLFFGQFGEAYLRRVCYQRGLPRLVWTEFRCILATKRFSHGICCTMVKCPICGQCLVLRVSHNKLICIFKGCRPQTLCRRHHKMATN